MTTTGQYREMFECPDCFGNGPGCETCGGEGEVPTWLKDPNINGEEAARAWGWNG